MSKNKYGYITEYYEKISSGEIIAPKLVIKQYKNIIELLETESDTYFFDEKAAKRIIIFSETFCKQSKDKYVGQAIQLILWQKAMYSCVYGLKYVDTKKRVIKKAVLEVGKKSGKSTVICTSILYQMLMQGQKIICASNGWDQSNIIYGEVKNMLEQSLDLKSRLKGQAKKMFNLEKGNFSTFEPLPKKQRASADGLLSTLLVLDEFWGMSVDDVTILENSQATVDQPLLFMISTAGDVREGAFDETMAYCKQVINGTLKNPTTFALLYTFDDPEEIKDENMWYKPSPSLDVIISKQRMREMYYEATGKPKTLAEFKTKFFNLISSNKIDNYFDYDVFRNLQKIDDEVFKGMCVGGIDLSRTNDLTCVSTMKRDDEYLYVRNKYFISSSFYEKILEDSMMGASYRYWVEQGYIIIAGTNHIDYRAIVDYMNEMTNNGTIYRYIGYDSYSATYLIDHLNDEGYLINKCLIPVIQGYKSLSVPVQNLESKLNCRQVIYDDPVTEWCISNVSMEQDRNGNMMPSKRNTTMKIDGFATILNANKVLLDNIKEF